MVPYEAAGAGRVKLILDCTALDLYHGWSRGGFSGGTETYVMRLASGLAEIGHTVHVVTTDVQADEQRGEREFWWPEDSHPTRADAVIMVPSVERIEPYSAELLIAATNGLGHYLGNAAQIDAFPVFSAKHAEMLATTQGVDPKKCYVTGLGIDLEDYGLEFLNLPPRTKVPGRIMVGNDPQRGLWHVLDIFDKLKLLVPHATLHVTYDCQQVFDQVRWQASHMASLMLDCERRLAATEGVTSLGALSRQELVREQLECQVHVWPSDPPNIGSQIHGLTQMECAAAGAALVLSDIEAFPEVFGAAAVLLPVPGTFVPQSERRVDAQDWAEAIAELMLDEQKWAEASREARALAEQHTWARVIKNWERMFETLAEGVNAKRRAMVPA